MKGNKTAFVFDTNFIIKHSNLNEIITQLEEKFTVYIAQITIDERIAQLCRDKQQGFTEAEMLEKKYCDVLSINYKYTIEDVFSSMKTSVQQNYENAFKARIIPFSKETSMFDSVIHRANFKLPPFSDAKDASDKGFKDCILWLSLLDYYKNNGEDKVIFITDDKAFLNKVDFLINEFREYTGKHLEIKPSSFYDELCIPDDIENGKEANDKKAKTIPNLSNLRDRIIVVIEGLRGIEYYNDFGDELWSKTFTTSRLFDNEYIAHVFYQLENVITDHILEQSIDAKQVLDFDGRITNESAEIPIGNLETALQLYYDIQKHYPNYIEQLYSATAKILNRNYVEPQQLPWEEEIPF